MFGALFREALSNLETVHGMHPLKIFCHHPGFVTLQGADKMPGDRGTYIVRKRSFSQQPYFFHSFLDIVFTKIPLSRLDCFEYGLNRLCFADGKQQDILRRAPGFYRCLIYPVFYGLELIKKLIHDESGMT